MTIWAQLVAVDNVLEITPKRNEVIRGCHVTTHSEINFIKSFLGHYTTAHKTAL